MVYRLIFAGAFLFLPACNSESVVDIDAKPNAIDSAATEPTDPDDPVKEPAALERNAEEAEELLEALIASFEDAQSKWMEQSFEERRPLMKNRPFSKICRRISCAGRKSTLTPQLRSKLGQ